MHFEGFAGEDVKNYYALADVLVLPSLSDAFGMTVLEAMACGLPMVVNQAAGASEVISLAKMVLSLHSLRNWLLF